MTQYDRARLHAVAKKLPPILFDGYAVLLELRKDKRAASRTGAENVSDVLDAIVRAMRAERLQPPKGE